MTNHSPILALYDATSELNLKNNSSNCALEVDVMQNEKPITPSRSHSDVKKKFAQIEKEMFAGYLDSRNFIIICMGSLL